MSWRFAAWAGLYVVALVLGFVAAREDAAGSSEEWPLDVLFLSGFLALTAAIGLGWVAGKRRAGGLRVLAAIGGGVIGALLYSVVLSTAY